MDCLRNLMLCAILFMFAVDTTVGQKMHTGDAKNYQLVNYDISDRTSLVFEVKACDNIHVLLMTNPDDNTNSVYEIVIGGWANTKSVIRKQILGTIFAENNSPRADCTVSKPFWIDWASGTITVGEGFIVGTGLFLSYTDTSPTPVNRFMISTGYGSSGQWQLGSSCSVRGDPHQKTLDGVKFTYSGICMYDILYIDNNFFISGHYERCRNVKSCLDEVNIHYKSHLISLLKGNIVKHGTTNVTSFPYTTTDDLITIRQSTAAYKYEVTLPNEVNVKWNGKNKLLIDVGMSFYGDTQGLCGLYNLNSADDLMLRNGTPVGKVDKDKFGNDWVVTGEYIGCYRDNTTRDLDGDIVHFPTDHTPQKCINHCKAQGYAYAGPEAGDWCLCGNSYGRHGSLPQSDCLKACTGDQSLTCGGEWAAAVYRIFYQDDCVLV